MWDCSSRLPPLSSAMGAWGSSSWPLPLTLDLGSSSQPFLRCGSLALSATAPDFGRGVTPLGCRPSDMGSSRLLPLTSDAGWLLSAVLWRAMSQPPELVIQVYAPTSNAEEAEVEISYILTQIQRKGGEEKPSEKLKEI